MNLILAHVMVDNTLHKVENARMTKEAKQARKNTLLGQLEKLAFKFGLVIKC